MPGVTPSVTLTATLQNLGGVASAASSLRITLCGYGSNIPMVGGTSVLDEVTQTIPFSVGTATIQLYGNDQISPSGTFYLFEVINPQNAVTSVQTYYLVGTGTVDLSALTPYDPTGGAAAQGGIYINFAMGLQGASAAPVTFAGTYAAGTSYTQSQAVLYAGSYYVSLKSTTNAGHQPDTSPAWWGPALAVAGPAGVAGPPSTFTGPWSGTKTYAAGQAVFFAGTSTSYASLQSANTNHDPSTSPGWWGILAPGGSPSVFGGAWVGGTTYGSGTIVSFVDGGAYVSLQDANTGHSPTPGSSDAWWGLLVPRGQAGAAGGGPAATLQLLAPGTVFLEAGVSGGSVNGTTGPSYTYSIPQPLAAGYLTSISALVSATGPIDFLLLQPGAGGSFSVLNKLTVIAAATGLQTWQASADYALIEVVAGTILAYYTAGSVLQIDGNASGPGFNYFAGEPAVGSSFQFAGTSGGGRLDLQATIVQLGQLTSAPAPVSVSAKAVLSIVAPNAIIQTAGTSGGTVSGAVGNNVAYSLASGVPKSGGWVNRIITTIESLATNGTLVIFGFQSNSSGAVFAVGSFSVKPKSTGLQTFVAGVDYSPFLLPPNSGLGWYTSTGACVGIDGNASGPGFGYYVGNPLVGANNFNGNPNGRMDFAVEFIEAGASSDSPVIATASSLGAVLDTDLSTGLKVGTTSGEHGTDNTAILNAFLATSTPQAPCTLILDGGTLTTGIVLPAGGHASIVGRGWDTGFYLANGVNGDVIANGGTSLSVPSDPGYTSSRPPVPARGANVTLRDFRINGNRINNGGPYPADTFPMGINMMSLDNILLENLWLYDTAKYNIRLSNTGHVQVRGCRIDAPSHLVNTDGVHINGPCNDFHIVDCDIDAGDDAVALNAPEGWGGDIAGGVISGCKLQGQSLVRMYTTNPYSAFKISGVRVSDCTGGSIYNIYGATFLLGYEAHYGVPDAITDVLVSNCSLRVQSGVPLMELGDSVGNWKFSNCVWDSPTDTTRQWVRGVDANSKISNLEFEGCTIYCTPAGSSPSALIENIVCGTLKVNGFAVVNALGTTCTVVPKLIDDSTIGHLQVDAVDMTNIATLLGPGMHPGQITTMAGGGILSTGAAVPDAPMQNGTMYLSATSGEPSIKIAGVVKTFNLS